MGGFLNRENAAAAWAGVWKDYADNEQQKSLGQGVAIDAARANLGIQSANASMMSAGYGLAGQRKSEAAQFQADQAEWSAKQSWGANLGGVTAAMGMFAGSFQAGSKPRGVGGMASDGMLDTYGRGGAVATNASGAYNYADPNRGGGYFTNVSNATADLNNRFGGSAVTGMYQQQSYMPWMGNNGGVWGGATGGAAAAAGRAGTTGEGNTSIARPGLPRTS
jgi:hypothetical protein